MCETEGPLKAGKRKRERKESEGETLRLLSLNDRAVG